MNRRCYAVGYLTRCIKYIQLIILLWYPLRTHNIHTLYTSLGNTPTSLINWNDGAIYVGRCHVCMWYFETIHRKCWCMYCWYSILTRSVLTQYCMATTMAKQRSAPNSQSYARNMGRKLWVHWEGNYCVTSIPHYILAFLACIHEYTEFMLWGNLLTPEFPFETSTMMGYIWR